MKSIVLASSNAHKLAEITAILGDCWFTLQPQSDFGLKTPPEGEGSFAENALIKARYACEHTGLVAISEDSGLEVDVLDGEPGIHSARYAGDDASDEDNLKLLLERIKQFPESKLDARFCCTVACIEPTAIANRKAVVVSATWEGRLIKSPSGAGGFGYDPVFFVAEYGCTAAELGTEVKNKISHRAQAFTKLRDNWAEYFKQ